jgi:hypothetical protein
MRLKLPKIGTLLIAAAVLAVPVSARVFRWLGPAATSELNNGMYPWEDAYQTTMTVNGRKTEMRLYSVRFSQPAVEQLRSRFEAMGATVSMAETAEGATGVAKWPDKEARFLVLSPPSEPRHLIFVFYPEPGSSPGAVVFPVPKYERGEVEYTISNDKTGTFSATLATYDSATQVHLYYAGRMAAEGWNVGAPALVRNGTTTGMAVYVKGKKVCYIQAVDRSGQSNMVTLLVKGGKL